MNNANNQKEKLLVGIWNKGEFSVSTQKRHYLKMTDIYYAMMHVLPKIFYVAIIIFSTLHEIVL